jgi:hypothetical protein
MPSGTKPPRRERRERRHRPSAREEADQVITWPTKWTWGHNDNSSSEVTPTGAAVVSTDRSSARLSPSPMNNSLQPIFEPWTASGPVERLKVSRGEHNMKHGRLAGAEDRKLVTGRVGEEGRGREPEEGWRQRRRSHRRHRSWGGAAITWPLPGRTGRDRHGCRRGSGSR